MREDQDQFQCSPAKIICQAQGKHNVLPDDNLQKDSVVHDGISIARPAARGGTLPTPV
jgi:hypothetical protein